jgi:NAD(P)-dependent dehydrogenase (short-subunit alcohol dehydrogenase family)
MFSRSMIARTAMTKSPVTILLIGASRGLGLGLAGEYLSRGWHVVATVRDPAKAHGLDALHAAHPEKLRIEALDVTEAGAAARLAKRLAGTRVDVLFVVAGRSGHSNAPIHEVPAEGAALEFMTNAYAPPVVAEALMGLLAPHAPVVFMTSGLGSIANNAGGYELYRASKAALNMFGSVFAGRHAERAVILMHPGWVRTDMGGSSAPLDVPTSVRGMADVIAARGGKRGVAYLDYTGATIPW